MSRSKWKGPYKKQETIQKRIVSKKYTNITPDMIGSIVWVHNGKALAEVALLRNEMIGHKIGEFVTTRTSFVFKKKKKK